MSRTIQRFLVSGFILFFFTAQSGFADTEPNDNFQQAEILAINQTVSGEVSMSPDDEDYYKIEFSTNLPTWIIADLSVIQSTLDLYDASGSQITSASENGTHYLYAVLTGGTYFFGFKSDNVSNPWTGTYQVTPHLKSDSLSGEPNNTLASAYFISTGTLEGYIWFSFMLGDNYDYDYYKISVPETTGIISLDIDMPLGKNYDINLLDNAGGNLESGNIVPGTTHKTLEYFFSSAGTYYVKINGSWGIDGADYDYTNTYSLTYDIQIDTGPGEPANNDRAMAYQISIGSIDGYIFDTGDPDWYKIVSTAAGSISLSLTMPSGKNYDIELYDNNGGWLKDGIRTDLTETLSYTANTGNYYAKIYGYSWDDYDRTNPYSLIYGFSATPVPIPSISLSPTTLSFTAVADGSNPSNKTFTVTNNGETDSTLSWVASDTMTWLTLSPTSSSLAKDGTATVTASVNISGLSTATYTGTITIADSNASNTPQTIAVTLSVTTTAAGSEDEIVTLQNNVMNFATNPSAQVDISFDIAQSGNVMIKIYTLDGVLVKTLLDENQSAGTISEQWNGKVESSLVPSGIYYVHIEAPGITETKKVCIVK